MVSGHQWVHTAVPLNAAGQRIEHWKLADKDSWFQVVGTLSVLEGEPGMQPDDVEHMEFHDHPPCPTEGGQVWRRLDSI